MDAIAVERITKDELKKKIEQVENVTILDVRNPVDYGKSGVKIKGAVRIPVDELSSRCGELDPSREVISYCT